MYKNLFHDFHQAILNKNIGSTCPKENHEPTIGGTKFPKSKNQKNHS